MSLLAKARQFEELAAAVARVDKIEMRINNMSQSDAEQARADVAALILLQQQTDTVLRPPEWIDALVGRINAL